MRGYLGEMGVRVRVLKVLSGGLIDVEFKTKIKFIHKHFYALHHIVLFGTGQSLLFNASQQLNNFPMSLLKGFQTWTKSCGIRYMTRMKVFVHVEIKP